MLQPCFKHDSLPLSSQHDLSSWTIHQLTGPAACHQERVLHIPVRDNPHHQLLSPRWSDSTRSPPHGKLDMIHRGRANEAEKILASVQYRPPCRIARDGRAQRPGDSSTTSPEAWKRGAYFLRNPFSSATQYTPPASIVAMHLLQ